MEKITKESGVEGDMITVPAAPENAEEKAKLINSLLYYLVFLYLTTMAVTLASRMIGTRVNPDAVAVRPRAGAKDVLATCIFFALTTVTMQANLACLLKRKPAPAPRLANRPAWAAAVLTWMCTSVFFLCYLSVGGSVMPFWWEYVVAGVASVGNLAIGARTVLCYVAVEGIRA